ncbi:hypothetical protein H072_7915 [Dactylellina haptotyla CBS 200.50]|uniref:Retinoic acid induced 16-like protein-domain-containing protein n=1 Tax=Dactylellina haptotyla (strain CBS 200.50) TaxID=1284197 RepID=S8AAP8_DACHA|nr:hypothetical protein H072_7915 [Dactylellina haptotyla CBS 200.50]
MDFWNRLIGNSPSATPTRKQVLIPSPDTRLQDFKRIWLTLQHTWRNGHPNDPHLQNNLRNPILRLTDLLIEEENQSIRLCYNYAYDQQIFIPVSRIAQNGSSVVITAVIRFFSTLIDDEENEFLSAPNFAQSLTDFLERTARKADPNYETEFVEFLFSLATKIRQNPDTLPLWFAKRGDRRPSADSNERFAGITNKEDFPLFYLLLDYVHHDGRVGDFARTGLLYIIESASSSKALETWIVESDLATIMASGLGALYSQLSRKLVIAYSEDDIPAALKFSDYRQESSNFGAVRSDSTEFRTHLDTFLSYMAFWQDVLEHCHSNEVRQTLLDHFKVLFIQQLLYPSLLESSDVDGGSSVAVLTYLRVILEQLDSTDMTHILLSYVLSLPTEPITPLTDNSPSMLKRKESLDMLSLVTGADSTPTPDLYSLVDLILTGLGSKSQPTVASTLRLVSAMVRKFHPYVAVSVLKTTPVAVSPKSRTLGMLNHELELLSSFILRVTEDDDDDPTYETYVSDMSVLVETHPCSAHMLAAKLNQRNQPPIAHMSAPSIKEHIVRPDDPVLVACLKLLDTFFGNTVETNLMLTSLLIDMASCCNVSLEKWLLMDASMYHTDSSNGATDDDSDGEGEDTFIGEDGSNPFGIPIDADDSDDEEIISAQLRKILAARKPPTKSVDETPFFKTLRSLVELVEKYRAQLPNLDNRLFERKNAFKFTESLNDALLNTHSPQAGSRRPSTARTGASSDFVTTPRRSASPAINAATAHLSPNKLPANMGSLRGRQGGHGRNISASVMNPFGPHLVGTQIRIKLVNGREIYNEQTMKPLPSLPGVGVEQQAESEVANIDVAETMSEAGMSSFSTESEEQHISAMTVSHLLTNIVILQEFLKELSALLQIRSSLYNDISFIIPS